MTPWPLLFKKELELIDEALKSEAGEKVLVEYMRPLVEETVDRYVVEHCITNVPREFLIQGGWRYFGQAIRRYRKQVDVMETTGEVYYFGSYFLWLIRQGIIDILKERSRALLE